MKPRTMTVSAAILVLLALHAQGQVAHTVVDSLIKVGHEDVKVVDRIVVRDPMVFRRPPQVRVPSCVVRRIQEGPVPKGCTLSAGRISHGIVAFGPVASLPEETIAQTFARVPGRDASNLFATVVAIQLSRKRTRGAILIKVIGSRVAIPVAQDDEVMPDPVEIRNRILLSFEAGKNRAQIAFWGSTTKPESYRITGGNTEAVLFVIPFRSPKGVKIVQSPDGKNAQTRDVQFVDGEYVLDGYSTKDGTRVETVNRDVVTMGNSSVPAILSR